MQTQSTSTNNIKQLVELGQSIWQDDISREMLQSGTLKAAIEETGIRGVTSNPTIFQKAMGEGSFYDDDIARLARQGLDDRAVFEALARSCKSSLTS